MLQLDTDLTDFYKHANTQERSWIVERKMGRLLRSQTVFEDLIKLILTTNCSWALTRKMTEAMARHLGTRVRNDLTLFPNAEALASKNEAFYRKKIRCGYRSAYLPTIARMVLGGKVRPERWRSNEISTEEIRKEILSIPGAGPYVAENLLRLLGKHDHLGLDRWARGKLKNLWNARRQPSDRQIRRRYHLHGRFRGLVLWCDLTQEWFQGGVFSDWIRMSPLKSQ
jgi:3-methyladenine DNA glycosylase/8-oxoguanine DNA glycosylase